jgi:hypothetical protein
MNIFNKNLSLLLICNSYRRFIPVSFEYQYEIPNNKDITLTFCPLNDMMTAASTSVVTKSISSPRLTLWPLYARVLTIVHLSYISACSLYEQDDLLYEEAK